ncbi:hypothetical protein FM076_28305 [Streptomyces albus subsp. chlorinus]|nr:hypothetical protein [Streptomyces albus subsp. chlorinus]
MRPTCFATNTADAAIVVLEPRHRQRTRAEDRVGAARAAGMRSLPLHNTARNQTWSETLRIALNLPGLRDAHPDPPKKFATNAPTS